ncbi:hypothetical protein PN836_007490 [Ningiella sp. W23]|uniref:hypothetical protein n=1 Tax=Ningiella sp. W23 TaxID=3023715 RepID=UPI003756A8A3
MEQDNSKDQINAKATIAESKNGRRKFLRSATAGALIASIPAKSVWATGGLTNSIVASGHGSDMAGNQSLHLQGPDYWAHALERHEKLMRFKDIFGRGAYNVSREKRNKVTVGEILTRNEDGIYEFGGENEINVYLLSTYFNALHHGRSGVVFPVVYTGGIANARASFSNPAEFATRLRDLSRNRRGQLARELKELHNTGQVSRLMM